MPKLEQFEIKKYWQIFSGLKPVENKVTHDQVAPILYNSKLDSSVLNKIWFLADIDDDDNLDFEEFVICMRLIFDMVNKNIESVPDELPDWLIPGSKAKFVQERKQRKQQENADIPKNEPPKVDWYMSPNDLKQYNKILDSCTTSTDGTYTFSGITLVLKSKFFNIGSSDFDKVWRLVNPKNLSSINKDPALYFVHILRQRNDVGAMIPSELPKSLLTTINKEEIKYDLNSRQSEVKRTSVPAPASTTVTSTPASTATTTTGPSNLDVSSITTVEQARLLREQFEGLLKYRQGLSAAANNPSSAISPGSFNINSITEDLDSIEQQVEGLEAYLSRKKQELASLQQNSHNLRG